MNLFDCVSLLEQKVNPVNHEMRNLTTEADWARQKFNGKETKESQDVVGHIGSRPSPVKSQSIKIPALTCPTDLCFAASPKATWKRFRRV